MLHCEECRCVSETAKGWLAFIAEDRDDEVLRIARRVLTVSSGLWTTPLATTERSGCRSRELTDRLEILSARQSAASAT